MASSEQQERLQNWQKEAGDVIKNVTSHNKRRRRVSSAGVETRQKSRKGRYREKLIQAAEEGIEHFGEWWLEGTGYVEAEKGEETFKFTQQEILKHVPIGAAQKAFQLSLPELGPYKIDYAPNGRHLLIGGRKGHLAEFDWQTGKLLTEIQVQETVRDVQFLHNHLYWAAAQKKYVFIYDNDGMELHRLKSLHEPYCLQFLPHHFLLCSTGNTGFVSWQDTSSGELIASFATNKGCCQVMHQNPSNAVIGLGHSFGSVSMWTPNMNRPVAQIKCHKTPVASLAFDKSGKYMVSAGMERVIKVWDIRKFDEMHCYFVSKTPEALDISQTGLLAIGYGTRAEIWKDALHEKQAKPYLTHRCTSQEICCLKFCPYEDTLGIGTQEGITQILVPGSGEPNFDSFVAHPFQNKKGRRESEIAQLLDKLPADMISLNPGNITKVNSGNKTEDKKIGSETKTPKKTKSQKPRKEIPDEIPFSLRNFYHQKKPTIAPRTQQENKETSG